MKRAGISLALVVMLLLGAAAPVQAQAEETGLAAEAESFYRSVLAAKDRETLQTYLDCFSDQRRVELRAELPATLRQGLDTVLQQMKLPSITPVEENAQQKETGWQLDATDGAALLVFLPTGADDVAAHDGFHGDRLEALGDDRTAFH